MLSNSFQNYKKINQKVLKPHPPTEVYCQKFFLNFVQIRKNQMLLKIKKTGN